MLSPSTPEQDWEVLGCVTVVRLQPALQRAQSGVGPSESPQLEARRPDFYAFYYLLFHNKFPLKHSSLAQQLFIIS